MRAAVPFLTYLLPAGVLSSLTVPFHWISQLTEEAEDLPLTKGNDLFLGAPKTYFKCPYLQFPSPLSSIAS